MHFAIHFPAASFIWNTDRGFGVIHCDGGVDFDGFSVEERRSVAPLANRFDGGAGEIGVDLAVLNP